MKEDKEVKIIAFLCNWCSYQGANLAGVSRIQYPPNIRVIRVKNSEIHENINKVLIHIHRLKHQRFFTMHMYQ